MTTTLSSSQPVPTVERYGASEVVLFPGSAERLYRVREGLVRLHTVDGDGNGLTLRYVKPGGYFGEEVLAADPLERHYYAEAVIDSEIESLDPSALDADASRALAGYLAASMQRLYTSLFRLGGMRLRSRIAAELLELSDSALASEDDTGQPLVRITHDDLAAAVGSVRETVTKVVGELVRLDAVDAGYGKIRLLDLERLRTIAGER